MKRKVGETVMACVLLVGALILPWKAAQERRLAAAAGLASQDGIYRVVLDAGHGGNDPGKVGAGGELEKDLNLAIVLYLKTFLEKEGVEVTLTRSGDPGLYAETDSNKKAADLKARCAIIDGAEPDIVVSIHQNSYHQSAVHGPQVFYYTGSVRGEQLAKTLQESFTEVIGAENTRVVKPNQQYYLLCNVKAPMVIVECGFLSNPEEAAKLASPAYQEQVAKALCHGIMQDLSSPESSSPPAAAAP